MDRDAFAELTKALAARDLVLGRRGTFGAAERVTAAVATVGYTVAPEPVRASVTLPEETPAAEPGADLAALADPEAGSPAEPVDDPAADLGSTAEE